MTCKFIRRYSLSRIQGQGRSTYVMPNPDKRVYQLHNRNKSSEHPPVCMFMISIKLLIKYANKLAGYVDRNSRKFKIFASFGAGN